MVRVEGNEVCQDLAVARVRACRILIDEAHSTFLFGPNGRGVAEHFGLDKEVV